MTACRRSDTERRSRIRHCGEGGLCHKYRWWLRSITFRECYVPRPAATFVTLLLAVTVPFGCRTTRKLELTQTGAPAFERFEAEYEFSAASFHLERTFATSTQEPQAIAEDSAVRKVSAQRTTPPDHKESDSGTLRTARLKIECPASADAPDEARLTLELLTTPEMKTAAKSGSANSTSKERCQLIVPRQQIELLIIDLARTGFFDGNEPPGPRLPLTVTIDGARVSRNWQTDDRLLDFAHRAFHLGRVIQE